MLEMAEMRRLEEQLRSLKVAQEKDRRTHRERHAAVSNCIHNVTDLYCPMERH